MEQLNKEIIGRNIQILRESLGLTQHDLALLTNISKRSIANIETGKGNFRIELLFAILNFYSVDISLINSRTIKVPEKFREKLIKHHQERKSENIQILTKRPTIVYAINYYLLPSSFLNNPREIAEIQLFFKKLGWEFVSSSITNALTRMPEVIEVRPHESKGNTNVYSKK
jgi:transcriptional regulator with XRE-family HTH domain